MSERFDHLVQIMARLRGEGGCPWDRTQTRDSLKPYLVEEAYEVLDTIDAKDDAKLKEELGDVLLQVLFHAEIGRELHTFTIDDVLETLAEKLIRRHPHVFGDLEVEDVDQVLHNWEDLKAGERAEAGGTRGALDGVPRSLPALAQALEIQSRAARLGFDWRSADGVRAKLREEWDELEAASDEGERAAEVGDLLFAAVNYARWLGIDPESSLRQTNHRFRTRFARMEAAAGQAGQSLSDLSLEELNRRWEQAKRQERQSGDGQ